MHTFWFLALSTALMVVPAAALAQEELPSKPEAVEQADDATATKAAEPTQPPPPPKPPKPPPEEEEPWVPRQLRKEEKRGRDNSNVGLGRQILAGLGLGIPGLLVGGAYGFGVGFWVGDRVNGGIDSVEIIALYTMGGLWMGMAVGNAVGVHASGEAMLGNGRAWPTLLGGLIGGFVALGPFATILIVDQLRPRGLRAPNGNIAGYMILSAPITTLLGAMIGYHVTGSSPEPASEERSELQLQLTPLRQGAMLGLHLRM